MDFKSKRRKRHGSKSFEFIVSNGVLPSRGTREHQVNMRRVKKACQRPLRPPSERSESPVAVKSFVADLPRRENKSLSEEEHASFESSSASSHPKAALQIISAPNFSATRDPLFTALSGYFDPFRSLPLPVAESFRAKAQVQALESFRRYLVTPLNPYFEDVLDPDQKSGILRLRSSHWLPTLIQSEVTVSSLVALAQCSVDAIVSNEELDWHTIALRTVRAAMEAGKETSEAIVMSITLLMITAATLGNPEIASTHASGLVAAMAYRAQKQREITYSALRPDINLTNTIPREVGFLKLYQDGLVGNDVRNRLRSIFTSPEVLPLFKSDELVENFMLEHMRSNWGASRLSRPLNQLELMCRRTLHTLCYYALHIGKDDDSVIRNQVYIVVSKVSAAYGFFETIRPEIDVLFLMDKYPGLHMWVALTNGGVVKQDEVQHQGYCRLLRTSTAVMGINTFAEAAQYMQEQYFWLPVLDEIAEEFWMDAFSGSISQ